MNTYSNIAIANIAEQATSIDLRKIMLSVADPLLETKVGELVTIYPRPKNCQYLVAPKINKMVWQKLKSDTQDVRS